MNDIPQHGPSANEVPCHGLTPAPFIKASYTRLALVSHKRHAAQCIEENTLIVSCDWLLAQELIHEGHHAVYYELGLISPPADTTRQDRVQIDCNDWAFIDGKDATILDGVSLGKQFSGEMTVALITAMRLERSLSTLIERFQPRALLLFDWRIDNSLMSPAAREMLVSDIAAAHGVDLINHFDPPSADDPDLPTLPVYGEQGQAKPARIKNAVRGLLLAALELQARITSVRGRDRYRVLLLVNQSILKPLLKRRWKPSVLPLLLADTSPKAFRFLWNTIRRGAAIAPLRRTRARASDNQRVEDMIRALEENWASSGTPIDNALRHYVREHILAPGRMQKLATQMRDAEAFLTAWQPDRILVDGVRNPPPRLFIELGGRMGIPVDYTWHSPLAPQNLRYDALGGDERTPAIVERCLSWGEINETWLSRIGYRGKIARTGCTISQSYDMPPPHRTGTERHILLLEYTPLTLDSYGLNHNKYWSFIEMERRLRELGFQNVRIKLHPGQWRKSYFERIAERFNLRAPILKSEPFLDCVRWSDVIIGPATSSTMQLALAANRPFYGLALRPHSLDMSYFDGLDIYESIDDALGAIENGSYPDAHRILNAYYSSDDIVDPSENVWALYANDAADRKKAS